MAHVSLEHLLCHGQNLEHAHYRIRHPKHTRRIPVHHDDYPSHADADDRSLALTVDQLLGELTGEQRHAVELVVFARLTYRQAAVELGWGHDGKKAWRYVQRGLAALRGRLEGGWPEAMASHRFPDEVTS